MAHFSRLTTAQTKRTKRNALNVLKLLSTEHGPDLTKNMLQKKNSTDVKWNTITKLWCLMSGKLGLKVQPTILKRGA